jgi:hypothetical protein
MNSHSHEIWTDAQCMLVPIDFYHIDNQNNLIKINQI